MNDVEDNKPKSVTADEAIAMLPERDEIHTFRNPAGGMMIGADWDRNSILTALRDAKDIQLSGPMATRMHHGLVINESGRLLFIETREAAVSNLAA